MNTAATETITTAIITIGATVNNTQSSSEPLSLLQDLPNANMIRMVRTQQMFRSIETIPDRGLYLRVIVPVNVLTIADDIRILQVLQRVPPGIAQEAGVLEQGSRDYTRLGLAREDFDKVAALEDGAFIPVSHYYAMTGEHRAIHA